MIEMKKTREGFGRALVELGDSNPNIVVLTGDLSGSTMVNFFEEKYPERFFNVGIAEQNMANIAAGLAVTGKIPFFSTYGAFASLRCADQIRITFCYSDINVNIAGAHGGISVGKDGATHQAMEEIAVMRTMPNMRVVVPCDYWETKKATKAIADIDHPCYIRFGRENVPVVTTEDTPFEFGKGAVYREGGDLTIFACGVMLHEAILAGEELAKQGIDARVINIHTIKPIDEDIIVKAAKETGAFVTAEEHQIYGGFGSAVAEVAVWNHPVPMEFVGMQDSFGISGEPDQLMDRFGMRAKDIVEKSIKVLKRK